MQKIVSLIKKRIFFARIVPLQAVCLRSHRLYSPSVYATFFLIFLGLQLGLFGLNMLNWVQQHVVLPWTSALASLCAGLVTWFDGSTAAVGKVLWNTSNGFGVSIEVNRPGFCRQLRASYFLSNRSPYEQSTLPRRIQDRGGQTNP